MHLEKESQDFLVVCYRKICAFAREQCHCRQCDGDCNLLSNICEHCGAQDPVRLPFAWLCGAAVLVVLLGAAGAWLL